MWIFLLVLLALFIASIVLTETEQFGWATFLLVVGVAVAQIFQVADMITWVRTHAAETLLYALAYVGIGVVWSFVKWFLFLLSFREKFHQLKAEFLQGLTPPLNPNGQVPEEHQSNFRAFLRNHEMYGDDFHGNSFTKRPQAVKNKKRIISWMSLWMPSMIGTLLNDPVRRLFSFLFVWFKSLYQKMSDKIFAKDVELQ